MFSKRRFWVFLLCTFAIGACQKKAAGPAPRYAVLRFENLSGDPSMEWAARAASEALAPMLAGTMDGAVLPSSSIAEMGRVLGPRPALSPGTSSERQEAVVAGATRLISGYVECQGREVRITAVEEDVSTGQTLRTVTAEAPTPMGAIEGIARRFSTHSAPPLTANPTAMRLYITALESPTAEGWAGLNSATLADPNFGPAWVALANIDVARGDREGAEQVIEKAREQKIDALSRARLGLTAADLQPNPSARLEALRKVVALSTGDITLLRTLAEAETAAGDFAAAAGDWRKLTVALPDDPATWNSLGYALSYSGDYKGALKALEEYERMRPKDANAKDSMGDLNYSFRKFPQAAANYMEGYKAQPDFLRYGELYKAAWAKFYAGDKKEADSLFQQFRAEREKMSDMSMPLVAADWFYRTGHKSEASDALRKTVAETTSDAVRATGYAQLTIWDLIGHNRRVAAKDSMAIGLKVSDAPTLIARFAALPPVSAAEWQSRAEHLIPPSMGPLRLLALGYALILDGKREAAIPVWEQIVQSSSATEFLPRAVYARLQGKNVARPLLPDPMNFNEFLVVLDTL